MVIQGIVVKQQEQVEAYVMEFQQKATMVTHISQKELTSLFVKGLMEPLRSLTKEFLPLSLNEAIQRDVSLEEASRSKIS